MNGCLGKILLVLTLLTAAFVGYPYFAKYLSDSAQDRIHQLETNGQIMTKMIKEIGKNKINDDKKEDQKNDDIKNQKIGQ